MSSGSFCYGCGSSSMMMLCPVKAGLFVDRRRINVCRLSFETRSVVWKTLYVNAFKLAPTPNKHVVFHAEPSKAIQWLMVARNDPHGSLFHSCVCSRSPVGKLCQYQRESFYQPGKEVGSKSRRGYRISPNWRMLPEFRGLE